MHGGPGPLTAPTWERRPNVNGPTRSTVPPPGSTPCRELLRLIDAALRLPLPAHRADELPYLRLRSERASAVLSTLERLIRDREDNPADLLAELSVLGGELAALPPGNYDHHGLTS